MEIKDLILIEQFCTHHHIEFSFINSLQEFGLIELIIVDDNKYLSTDQLSNVEKMMRLHYELNINLEGIDVISNLLRRIEDLQHELVVTKNKLGLYDI